MDYKIFSRKLILSVLLCVLATVFIKIGRIADYQWQFVITTIAVTYIGSKMVDKIKNVTAGTPISFIDRVVSLFSREFILALVIIIVSSLFLYWKNISGNVWFEIVSAIGSAYNIFNVFSKKQ